MPHRNDQKHEERPGKGARRQGTGDNWYGEDSTSVSLVKGEYGPEGRKSGPGAWVRLADVLSPMPWRGAA